MCDMAQKILIGITITQSRVFDGTSDFIFLHFVLFNRHLEEKMDWLVVSVTIIEY